MSKLSFKGPRRTREHIIASQSHNFIEKFFIDRGHAVDRPDEDYGHDVVVSTFDADGYAEAGEIHIQLKASDRLKWIKKGTTIAFEIATKPYVLWADEPMPVFLVLFDAVAKKAYRPYVQEYLSTDPSRRPEQGMKSLTLRIPAANLFNEATVDYAREEKSKTLARFRREIAHGQDTEGDPT